MQVPGIYAYFDRTLSGSYPLVGVLRQPMMLPVALFDYS